MVLSHGNGTCTLYHQDEVHADQVRYFQGDSPSPLSFCMALNPLSAEYAELHG